MNDYAMPCSNEHKPTLVIMNHTSPIYEYERHEGEDLDDYHQDQDASSSPPPCGVGGCFGLFWFASCTWRQNHDSDSDYEWKYLLQQGGWHKDTTWWWRRNKLKKAKEFTRVLGGYKWKAFIKKIAGYCKTTKQKQNRLSKKQKQKNTRFQYDLHSYALNFDGGVARDADYAAVDFVAGFAAPLSNEHGSIGRLVHQTTHESASIESKL